MTERISLNISINGANPQKVLINKNDRVSTTLWIIREKNLLMNWNHRKVTKAQIACLRTLQFHRSWNDQHVRDKSVVQLTVEYKGYESTTDSQGSGGVIKAYDSSD